MTASADDLLDRMSREIPATAYIPYKQQIDLSTVSTIDDDVTCSIRLQGVPFETMTGTELNGLSRVWASTLHTLGARDTRVALWTHIIRRRVQYDLSKIAYDNHFSQDFGMAYAERVGNKNFYVNDLILSPVYRPAAGTMERIGKRFSKKEELEMLRKRGAQELNRISSQLMKNLRRFHPSLIGTEEGSEDSAPRSHIQELYGLLVNGERVPVNMEQYSVRYAIQRNELNFGNEIITIRGPLTERYAAVLTIKPPYGVEKIRAGILHDLLRLPCEYVLSQSQTFMPANKAEKFLKTQISQYGSTSDNEDQIAELREALKNVQSGKWTMGEHEFILTIYGDTVAEVNEGIGEALAALEGKNIQTFREARGMLIAQYFGMLPGNFINKRPRAVPLSTDNFAAFFPLHNFFTGNPQGSQWGMPVTMFETTSNAPMFFTYHVPRKRLMNQGVELQYDEDAEERKAREEEERAEAEGRSVRPQRKEIGNPLVVGPSGSGKTATKMQLRVLARKLNLGRNRKLLKTFAWDKDYGEEIGIRALGGTYFTFEPGRYTGLNPFGLANTPANRQFILDLTMWCAKRDPRYIWSVADEQSVLNAIDDVYSLPDPRDMRFARLQDTIKTPSAARSKDATTLKEALSRWIGAGSYAWVLDSPKDMFDFSKANDFGFDMTKFLNIEDARTPIQLVINQKIENSVDGSPFILDIAEAWKALKDPYLQAMMEDKAKTVRKLNGILGFDTQDPTDITKSPIAGTLLQQFPTKILLPNPSADPVDYIEGLKLTPKQFDLVRNGMNDEPGKFLLMQGTESVVVRNDLSGMDNQMAVLSSSTDNVLLVRELIQQLGPDPKVWLPEFYRKRT